MFVLVRALRVVRAAAVRAHVVACCGHGRGRGGCSWWSCRLAVWLCVRVRAADGLSAVRACAGLSVGCRALRWAPVAPGGGVRVAQGVGWRACARGVGGGVPGGWCPWRRPVLVPPTPLPLLPPYPCYPPTPCPCWYPPSWWRGVPRTVGARRERVWAWSIPLHAVVGAGVRLAGVWW